MQSPGGGVARLWRPAAQRHVRNAWAVMHSERAAWASASSASFQAATALVNLALSRRYRVFLFFCLFVCFPPPLISAIVGLSRRRRSS